MRSPNSVSALEKLGRERLSQSFFMRDFLYSEIGNFYGMSNIPEDPDLALSVGRNLCQDLLEPPPRQNSCRPDKSRTGGGDEGR